MGVGSPQRIYVTEGNLLVTAPGPATAQATLETAVAAINAALEAGSTGVQLQLQKSEGQFVLDEQ